MFIQGVLGDHCDIVPLELGYHRKRFLLVADTVVMLSPRSRDCVFIPKGHGVVLETRDRDPVLDPNDHGAVLETDNENLLEGQPPHGRTR